MILDTMLAIPLYALSLLDSTNVNTAMMMFRSENPFPPLRNATPISSQM